MKYEIVLNGKIYEVTVERGEAVVEKEYAVPAPSAPAPVIAPVPVAAPAPAPVPAAPAPVPAAPAPAPAPAGGEAVNSPLPGTILEIKVNPGDSVKAGQVLLLIEAMKMENEVCSPRDGTVSSVAVNKGATVDTGTLLITLA